MCSSGDMEVIASSRVGNYLGELGLAVIELMRVWS